MKRFRVYISIPQLVRYARVYSVHSDFMHVSAVLAFNYLVTNFIEADDERWH
jgi:hypothetical protein